MGTLSVKFGFKNKSCLNSTNRRMSLFILPNKPFQGQITDTVLTFCFFWVKPKENVAFSFIFFLDEKETKNQFKKTLPPALIRFYKFSFSYFFKKVLQKHKHIKPCMLSVALTIASIALNIGHAHLRQYMFTTRLFYASLHLLSK